MTFSGERSTWYVPSTLTELLALRYKYPYARIVGGNSEVGIETTIKGYHYAEFLSPVNIEELNKIEIFKNGRIYFTLGIFICIISRPD